MINELAYKNGVSAAWMTFTKTATGSVAVTAFPKKPVVTPNAAAAAPGAPPPVPAAPVAPQFGGAAAPPAPGTPGAPAVPAAGGWKDTAKGMAKDIGIQMAVPLGMMGLQKMMEPSQPRDPNAI